VLTLCFDDSFPFVSNGQGFSFGFPHAAFAWAIGGHVVAQDLGKGFGRFSPKGPCRREVASARESNVAPLSRISSAVSSVASEHFSPGLREGSRIRHLGLSLQWDSSSTARIHKLVASFSSEAPGLALQGRNYDDDLWLEPGSDCPDIVFGKVLKVKSVKDSIHLASVLTTRLPRWNASSRSALDGLSSARVT
jgi:hypothetical protein